jgi:hypothetical protein
MFSFEKMMVTVVVAVAVVASAAFFFCPEADDMIHTGTPGPGPGPDHPEPTAPVEPEAGPAEPPATLPRERGNGLRSSRWAVEGYDPIAARRARGLPANHREAEEGGWLVG